VEVAEIWAEWGELAYLGAALWAFFEGETFVLLASAAGKATGTINPWYLLGAVWLGSYAGDQLWFTLGRHFGAGAVRKIPGAERRLDQALRFLDRYGTLFVLCFRFVYGVRNVASAACGIAGMSWAKFAFWNFLAAGAWASSFVAAGWFLAEELGPQGVYWLLAGGGACLAGLIVYKIWRAVQRATHRHA
jgi:membrane protein DedA with SNARE-associated domain